MSRQVIAGSGTEIFFGILHPSLLEAETITPPPDVLVTTGGAATTGAATLTVSALAAPLPAGSALLFYPTAQLVQVTLSAAAAKGATSLAVTALTGAIAAKSKIKFVGYEFEAEVSSAAVSTATTVQVKALKEALLSGAVGYVFTGTYKVAYTSANASAGATTVEVLALDEAIASGSIALHKGLLKLYGGTSASEEISTDEETITIFGDEQGYATGNATSASWSMSYDALVLPLEPGYYRLSYAAKNAVKGVQAWVRKRDSAPQGYTYGEQFEGLCQVIGRSKENPADGNVSFSTSFNGRGEPQETPPRK